MLKFAGIFPNRNSLKSKLGEFLRALVDVEVNEIYKQVF